MNRVMDDPLLRELIDTVNDARACANRGTQGRLLNTLQRLQSRQTNDFSGPDEAKSNA